MSMPSLQALKELREHPQFKDFLKEAETLMPYRLLYKDSSKESNDKQVSDWIFNSGRVAQGKIFLEFLTGKTDEDSQWVKRKLW